MQVISGIKGIGAILRGARGVYAPVRELNGVRFLSGHWSAISGGVGARRSYFVEKSGNTSSTSSSTSSSRISDKRFYHTGKETPADVDPGVTWSEHGVPAAVSSGPKLERRPIITKSLVSRGQEGRDGGMRMYRGDTQLHPDGMTRWPGLTSAQGLLRTFDWVGTMSFAASGCLTAGNMGLDVFGCSVVGTITALGGGTVRDMMLAQRVGWMDEPGESVRPPLRLCIQICLTITVNLTLTPTLTLILIFSRQSILCYAF
jgi:hypothetical protein